MGHRVKWGRSEEGYVESKCGRFDIVPLWMGTTRPQAYDLIDSGPKRDQYKRSMHDTQTLAKEAAEDIVEREQQPRRKKYAGTQFEEET